MSDVEGVRNLIGTGLVDFVGGIITALIAFVVLMKISPIITLIIFTVILLFATLLQKTSAHRCGRSSASAARSMPKSPDGSPSRWAACGW